MTDENAIMFSPRKLRNHSQSQSLPQGTAQKMAGKLPENSVDHAVQDLIQKEDFVKRSTTQKLDSVAEAINKMYEKMNEVTTKFEDKIKPLEEAIFNDEKGMVPQLESVIEHSREVDQALQTLTEENLQLKDELDILKGVVHKLSNQLDSANSKINQLVAKSMEDNLIISGVLDDLPKKKVCAQIHQFLFQQVELPDVRDNDILKVYRIGQPENGKHRAIMLQCTADLRRYIMTHAPNLKDKTNQQGGKFYINQQLPEAIAEQKREICQIIKEKQKGEEQLPQSSRSRILVKNNKVFINGQLIRKTITPPSVSSLFPEEDQQKRIDAIKLRTFRSKPDAGSTFRVTIFRPDSLEQVKLAYVKMFQNYSTADHIAVACKIDGQEAYNDNAEFGAGMKMMKAIRESGLDNVVLFMIRQYGGINLGPRRFKIISDLATIALQKAEEQQNKQTVRSTSSSPSTSRSSSPSDQTQEDLQKQHAAGGVEEEDRVEPEPGEDVGNNLTNNDDETY